MTQGQDGGEAQAETLANAKHKAGRWADRWPLLCAVGTQARLTRLVYLVAACVALLHLGFYFPRTVDDMFIYLRYGENIAAGLGAVYNAGEPVEGFSSPLFMALVALGDVLGVGGVTWTKVLALGSFACVMLGTARVSREVFGLSPLLSAVSVLAVALNSYVVSWTMYGLETPLFMATLLFTILLTHRALTVPDRRTGVALGLVGGALTLSRPEGALYLAAIGVGALLNTGDAKAWIARLRTALLPVIIATGIFLGYLSLRLVYFGRPFAHTYYAKRGHGADLSRLLPLVDQGASPLEVALLVVASLGLIATLVLRRKRLGAMPLLTALACLFFVSLVERDWMPNMRHFLPLVLLMPAAALSLGHHLPRRGLRIAVTSLSALLVLGASIQVGLADARYSPADFSTHGRGQHWIRPKTTSTVRDTWQVFARQTPEHIKRMDGFHHGMLTQVYRLFEADATPLKESWYVGRDIGRVGWLADVRVFDTDGLFTPAITASPAFQKDESIDSHLAEAALDRHVVGTEVYGPWAEAIRVSPKRTTLKVAPNGHYPFHWVSREVKPPSMQMVRARYERAREKFPSSYYLMTLYGEAVGAAFEKRYALIAQATDAFQKEATRTQGAHDIEGLRLHRCTWTKAHVRPGETTTLECTFERVAARTRDFTVFVHLEGPGGRRMLADHNPVAGLIPFSQWPMGEPHVDTVSVNVPEDWPEGEVRTYVGLFTGNRRAKIQPPQPGDRVQAPLLHVGR